MTAKRTYPALLFAVALLWGGAAARDGLDRWVANTAVPPVLLSHSIEVRDRHGNLLRAYTVDNGRWRLPVTLDQVDPAFTRLLITYEDRRFWQHSGVDPYAMLRAALQGLRNGRIISGGSTISMQVARLMEQGSTGQWTGKLRQIRLALALERQLSKSEILTLYLNLAPYGGNLEGIRAATLAYFGKEPRRLTPAEAALLVALPQSPENRRPDRYVDRATAARDRVLTRGQNFGVLTPDDLATARFDPVPARRQVFPLYAPHAADRALQDAADLQRHDLTIDLHLQKAMEQLAADAMQDQPNTLSIALLVADHSTGEILASVGSKSYTASRGQGFVDMTRALRSPGSTLKPLVYAMAYDQGLGHPETLIHDRPVTFDGYAPQNFDGQFRGDVTMGQALQQSLNIPVVLLTQSLGPNQLLHRIRLSGAKPQLPTGKPGLALALGGLGITLWDLVQLYAGLANHGQTVTLTQDLRNRPTSTQQQLVKAAAAWHVGNTLADLPPPRGTAPWRIAYKTGTSYGHRDTWAVGYDGQHVIGIWIGRPDGTPVPGAFGADLAAPVLFQAFQRLKSEATPLPPPPADTLILTSAELPQALQRFRDRQAIFAPAADAPKLTFPPEGARLDLANLELIAKLQDGIAPFTFLTNGQPVLTGAHQRQVSLPDPGPGFTTLTVIDAKGRSDKVTLRLE